MANPVYIGTFEEVLGPRLIGSDGWNAEPFVQVYEPGVLAALDTFSRRREYWLDTQRVEKYAEETGEASLDCGHVGLSAVKLVKGDNFECPVCAQRVIRWRVPDIREAVRAPLGKKIFSADYSQIEVKIMAWLSQDPFLLAAISSGKDVHSYMASEIFGIPYDDFVGAINDKGHPKHKEYSKIRSSTKTTTFGIPYGASARRIALMTGMSEDDAQKFIDQYFAKAAVLKLYLDRIRREAVQNKCSRSPRGRVRWYEVPPRGDTNYRKVLGQIERFAGNHPIQAGCVDLLKPAMAYFYLAIRGAAPFYQAISRNGGWASDRLFPHAALILAVHDELVGECDAEDAGRTCDCKKVAKEAFIKNGKSCVRNCVGPVPQLLKASMEQAYNDLSTHIKMYDDDGVLTRQEIFIRDIPNKVDVVVNDYWSKD